ncbi:putative transporter small subunit [Shewanella sp.]
MMLSLYILIWPVISAVVLFVIVRAFIKDMAEAKREGRSII